MAYPLDVDAWNALLEMFLRQLTIGFPKRRADIERYLSIFQDIKSDPSTKGDVLKIFMVQIAPYAEYIKARDEEFFLSHEKDIKMLRQLGLSSSWNAQLPAQTKAAVWKFMNQLMEMGASVLSGDTGARPPRPTTPAAPALGGLMQNLLGGCVDPGMSDMIIKVASEAATKLMVQQGEEPMDKEEMERVMKRFMGQ